jgi:hypothetical protein
MIDRLIEQAFPTVAEGLMLRSWSTGPRAGQP